MRPHASECEAGQRDLRQRDPGKVEVWRCGLAARAALCLGHVRQRLLNVLAATGPGDLAALVAGGGTAHDVLLRGNESRLSLGH